MLCFWPHHRYLHRDLSAPPSLLLASQLKVTKDDLMDALLASRCSGLSPLYTQDALVATNALVSQWHTQESLK